MVHNDRVLTANIGAFSATIFLYLALCGVHIPPLTPADRADTTRTGELATYNLPSIRCRTRWRDARGHLVRRRKKVYHGETGAESNGVQRNALH